MQNMKRTFWDSSQFKEAWSQTLCAYCKIWNMGHDLPTQSSLCLQMWDYHCQIDSSLQWNTAIIKVCSKPASVPGHVLQPL